MTAIGLEGEQERFPGSMRPASRRERDAFLRADLGSFLAKAVSTIHPGTVFQSNWHIHAVTHVLDEVFKGQCLRLIINQPPRSLKSIATSVSFVAWLLGGDPALRVIVVSYNRAFAIELHRQFRQLVDSEWYRRLFPGTQWQKETDTECVTTKGGGRFATSIGGELTGRGGDLLIIDDPMNASEVNSEAARRKVTDFYSTALVSRLNDKKNNVIILVMQRLHEEDLAGYLLEQGGWHHLNLPAIAPEDADVPIGYGQIHHRRAGDVLHLAREDRETLDRLRAELGSLTFSAQYQQAPLPLEGNLIKRSWIEASAYSVAPAAESTWRTVQSWDVATATGSANDYSVCTTWLVNQTDAYLIDVWRGRRSFPDLHRKIGELAVLHGANTVIIEEAGPGLQLLQFLRENKPPKMVKPIGFKPVGSKADRMSVQSCMIENGQVHFPREEGWLDTCLLELLGFPHTRYDDQVDSISQFLAWWSKWRSNSFVVVAPIIVTGPRYDPFDFVPR